MKIQFAPLCLARLMMAAASICIACPQLSVAQTRPVPLPIDPKLPTLWIIGDSTVKNGQDTGNNGQWGWGNPIAAYFDKTKINIQNKALGGTSSRTFMTNGLWDKVLSQIKPGDFLIMQFGHNDASPINDNSRARGTIKGNGEETQEIDNMLTGKHEVVHSYGWYLRKYVSDAQAKGVKEVIICSPIPHNRWTNGKANRTETYTQWAKEAAKQAGVDFINLNEAVAMKYDAAGQAKVTAEDFPDKETTHTDWAGAVINAQTVIELIKGLPHSDLVGDMLANPPTDLKNPMGRPR